MVSIIKVRIKVLGQYLQAVGRKSKVLINKFGEVKFRNPEELLKFLDI